MLFVWCSCCLFTQNVVIIMLCICAHLSASYSCDVIKLLSFATNLRYVPLLLRSRAAIIRLILARARAICKDCLHNEMGCIADFTPRVCRNPSQIHLEIEIYNTKHSPTKTDWLFYFFPNAHWILVLAVECSLKLNKTK